MEAIALQTRHIVDELNSKGHQINTIYMSGGQANNIPLMQLLADICQMPVVLPYSHSNAVVLGAAMLGRFAAQVSAGKMTPKSEGEALWKIMVCTVLPLLLADRFDFLPSVGRDDTTGNKDSARR
jgi:sugar (pentulose or hexulose) kinase